MYQKIYDFFDFTHFDLVRVLVAGLLSSQFSPSNCASADFMIKQKPQENNFTDPFYYTAKPSPLNPIEGYTEKKEANKDNSRSDERDLLSGNSNVRVRRKLDENDYDIPCQIAIFSSFESLKLSEDNDVPIDIRKVTKNGSNALHSAAREGTLSQVKRSLSAGLDVNSRNNFNNTPVLMACCRGELSIAKYLVDQGAILTEQSHEGHTTLLLAILSEKIGLIDLCLTHAPGLIHIQDYDGYSPLHYAVMTGKDEIVKKIITALKLSNASNSSSPLLSIDCKTNSGITPLAQSLYRGYLSIAKLLVEAGASIDTVDTHGGTILHLSAEGGDYACVEYAIAISRNKFPIDTLNYEGRNALHLAVKSATPETCDLLVKEGISPESATPEGFIPLILAASFGNYDLVKHLIEKHNVSCSGKDLYGGMVLQALCSSVSYLIEHCKRKNKDSNPAEIEAKRLEFQKRLFQCAHFCLQQGADVHAVDRFGFNALHYAIQNSSGAETVELLLTHGLPLEGRIHEGATPLLFALEAGSFPLVKLLLDRGANIFAVDKQGRNALHCAAQGNCLSSLAYCINLGIDLEASDNEGLNALHYAARYGSVEIVDALIDYGLNLDNLNNRGFTPFMYALGSGNYPVARHLIKKGARRDIQAHLLVSIASRSSSTECIELSFAAGGDVFNEDEKKWTPLHWASSIGDLRCVKLLLSKIPKERLRLSVNAEDSQGVTPLMVALGKGHIAVALELVRVGADMTHKTLSGETTLHHFCKNLLSMEPYYRVSSFYREKHPELRNDQLDNLLVKTSGGKTCVMYAAENNALNKVCDWKHLFPLINGSDTGEITPLMIALANGYSHLAQNLIKWNVFFNKDLANKHRIILDAAQRGSEKCVELCLALGCDSKVLNEESSGLLHCVAQHDLFSLVEKLVQNGNAIDSEDSLGRTPLMVAMLYGNYNTACALIRAGAKCDRVSKSGTSMVGYALVGASDACVRKCLAEYSRLRKIDSVENNSFYYAAITEGVEFVDLLFRAMPEHITKKDSNGDTALMIALKNNNKYMALKLLDLCPQLATMADSKSITPLEFAVKNDLSFLVSALLSQGADAKQVDHRGLPLVFDPLYKGNRNLAAILIKAGASPYERDPMGGTALFDAIIHGSITGVELCLEYDIDPYAVNIDKWTWLHVLSYMRSHWRKELAEGIDHKNKAEHILLAHESCVRRVLCEANVLSKQDIHGWTPLHHAAKGNDVALIRIFNEYNPPLEILSHEGFSAFYLGLQAPGDNNDLFKHLLEKTDKRLHHLSVTARVAFLSALYGDEKTFEELLPGVHSSYKTSEGRSLFHCAAQGGNVAIVKRCREFVQSLDSTDNKGMTAVHIAAEHGHEDVVKYLAAEGASLTNRTEVDLLPIHLAAQSGNSSLVNFLASRGSSINSKTSNNSSILHFFAQGGFFEAVENFKERGILDEPNLKNQTAQSILKKKVDDSLDERLSDEIASLHKVIMVGMQDKLPFNLYTQRRPMYNFLRKLLERKVQNRSNEGVNKKVLPSSNVSSHKPRCSSQLGAIPLLDRNTFARAVKILEGIYKKCDAASSELVLGSLLTTWSYVSGIPIIGLKNDGEYYFKNEHLRWVPQSNLAFSVGSIYERVDEDTVKTVDLPQTIIDSGLFFRTPSCRLGLSNTNERQSIAWPLLKDEYVSLETLPKDLLKSTLATLLRLDMYGAPLVSCGIANLFKNTALYLSNGSNKSRIIASPFSVAATSYLGFQDGILLEAGNSHEGVLEMLMGKQFFRRAFFRSFSDSVDDQYKIDSAQYVPHYDLNSSLLPSSLKEISSKFARYLQRETDSDPNLEIDYIKQVVSKLDEKQLMSKLISYDELRRRLGHDPLANNGVLSFKGTIESLSADREKIAYEDDLHREIAEKVTRYTLKELLDHLGCVDFQETKKLILSNNGLVDSDIEVLGQRFSENILTNLEELDLSDNSLSESSIDFLSSLLNRGSFKLLILCNNILPRELRTSSDLLNKIVWLPQYAFNRFKGVKELCDNVEKNHHTFYNRI